MEGVFYLERLVVSGYYAVCHNQCVTLASLVSKNMQIDPIANCLNTHHLLLSILGASAYESFAPIEIYLFPNVVILVIGSRKEICSCVIYCIN